ncbi:MAG: VOC family protein [Burkholderiaceae bacterium]
MAKAVFINLPIGNLKASMAFYDALGFKNKPQFTDDNAACMVYSDAIYVMLHSHDSWRRFTTRPIPPSTSSEVMLALSVDNAKEVDALNDIAQANGGTADINPKQDLGFMYSRAFTDPDGHIWEPFWMDPAAIPA